jgi:hypothetical protein
VNSEEFSKLPWVKPLACTHSSYSIPRSVGQWHTRDVVSARTASRISKGLRDEGASMDVARLDRLVPWSWRRYCRR